MSYLHEVQKQLLMYKPKDMVDEAIVGLFQDFFDETKDVFNRENYDPGHLTSSAFIVNKERTHCVLMNHKKLNKWLQPGGHIEHKMSPLKSAQKEALEETGLKSATPTGKIHNIDAHVFPEKADKNQPEHMHYDITYLFEADLNEEPVQNEESNGVRWFTLDEAYKVGDGAVQKMIEKL